MTAPSTGPDPLIGQTLRAYEIQDAIGVSRWGKVYRALQKTTNRTVAVRVLSPALAAVSGRPEQFLEESRGDASLTHPHLVTIYEAGQAGGTYFCAMEYMDGPPLRQLLRKDDGVNEHYLLQTVAGVARALDFLWQHNIPHQPPLDRNVLTTTDGVVKLINVEPAEMQASPSPQEDVVSLAVMVAMLTNDIGPVSKSISELVEGMLGTEGRERFSSLAQVTEAADALDSKLFPPVHVTKPGTPQTTPKQARRPSVAAVALLAVVVAMVAVWCWWRHGRH